MDAVIANMAYIMACEYICMTVSVSVCIVCREGSDGRWELIPKPNWQYLHNFLLLTPACDLHTSYLLPPWCWLITPCFRLFFFLWSSNCSNRYKASSRIAPTHRQVPEGGGPWTKMPSILLICLSACISLCLSLSAFPKLTLLIAVCNW